MAEATLEMTLPDELWYFNGEAPPGYATDAIIGIRQQEGSFLWSVAPASRLRISSHTSPTPEITPIEPSTSWGDVTVTCRWVGPHGSKQLFVGPTTVLAPDHLEPLGEIDLAHAGYGYESHIRYRIVDQFGRILPMDVPINESFGTEQLADCDPMTWRRGPEEGRLVSPADWFDQVQGEVLWRRPPAQPTPSGPMSPNANLPVCHWAGDWRVGNVRIGTGRPVRLGVLWLKHLGFARHG